jgi:MFS family permease
MTNLSEGSAAAAGFAPRARASVFAESDFRRLWLVGLVVFAVRWLEMLAVAVFVYQRTGSPFLVAMMMMLRMLPMSLFGAVIGAAAERIDRRKALLFVVAGMMASSLSLALLAFAGQLAVWHLAVASFWNGIGWTCDNPVRRTLIGDVVGPLRLGRAMSVDVGANNASRMLGPTIGGLLLAGTGIGGAFSISVLCYLVAIAAVLSLRHREAGIAPGHAGVIARIAEGLRLVRGDPRLLGVLVVTVIFNMFGWPFTSMIPVIGQDNLHLAAGGIGVLASMDGVGAFLGAVAIALWARPSVYGRLYIGGVVVYQALVIVVALLPFPILAGAVLLASGFASAGFSIMQATLVYLSAPAHLRSCLYGVLSVCIGIGLLGFIHLGLLAQWIGAAPAIVAVGIEGLLALLLTRPLWQSVLR